MISATLTGNANSWIKYLKGNGYILGEANSVKHVLTSCVSGVSFKGKNLLPRENSFPLSVDPY